MTKREKRREILWKQWKQCKFVVVVWRVPPAVACWLSLAAALRGVFLSLGSIGCPKET
jgi:hypothetical protein